MYSKIFIGIIWVVTVLLTQTPTTDGAKILAVYVYPGPSHFQMHRVIIKELVKHGHEGMDDIKIPSSAYDFADDPTLFNKIFPAIGLASTEYALQQPNVQAIINAKQTKGVYDLLLVEQLKQEAFLALAHIYDVPVISTATFAQQTFMSEMFGFISPLSYVPPNSLSLTDHMNFWERVTNTYYTLYYDLERQMDYFPKNDMLIKKYFGHLPIDFPSTSAMHRNLSAILINNYTPLAYPGPKMDNMINVGGMHIYPNKSLPSDIQTFLDEAEHGAIYFSLGTGVRAAELPQEKILIFVDVFRNLKQRVLWKFENASLLGNVPNNVMIKPWMPQNDILPHHNIRAFISHGGLFGTQETVYYGVPVVGIPFFFDQHVNIKKGVQAGYTVPLNIRTLTRDDLKNAIDKILYDTKYRDTMQRMSKIFRDRTMGPRETAMYWIDYVIRHKGARHMRAAGLDLKWYQFYLLDVIAFFVATVAVPLGFVLVLVLQIWRRFKGGPSKQKVH